MTNFLFWSVPIARSLTTRAGSRLAWPMPRRANCPGISLPSVLAKTARTRTVPLLASTWLSISCRRPVRVAPLLVAVTMRTGMRSSSAGALPSCPSDLSARHHLLIGVEAGIDRVDRDQRREDRCPRARGHQVADRDFQLADPPSHRGADRGVAQVELRGLQRRLGRSQVCFRLALGVETLVEIALRHCSRIPQL